MSETNDRPGDSYNDPTAPPPDAGSPQWAPTPGAGGPAEPPADGQPPASDPYRSTQQPPGYGQPPAYGQGHPYEQQQPPPGYGQPPAYRPPAAYGQPPAYGQQYPYEPPPPYGAGPSPYVVPGTYGQPAPSNGNALTLTIISGIATFLCCTIFTAPALIFGIVALTKQTNDPVGSARMTRYGWIAFGIAMALGLIMIVGFVVAGAAGWIDGSGSYDYEGY